MFRYEAGYLDNQSYLSTWSEPAAAVLNEQALHCKQNPTTSTQNLHNFRPEIQPSGQSQATHSPPCHSFACPYVFVPHMPVCMQVLEPETLNPEP